MHDLKNAIRKALTDPNCRKDLQADIADTFLYYAIKTQPQFLTDLWTQNQFAQFANEAASLFLEKLERENDA